MGAGKTDRALGVRSWAETSAGEGLGYICHSHFSFHRWDQFFSLHNIFSYVDTKCVPVASMQAMPSPLCSAMSNSESYQRDTEFHLPGSVFKAAGSEAGACGSPILQASGQICHLTGSEYSPISAGSCGFLGLCGSWRRHYSPFLALGFLAQPWATPLGIICFSSSIREEMPRNGAAALGYLISFHLAVGGGESPAWS